MIMQGQEGKSHEKKNSPDDNRRDHRFRKEREGLQPGSDSALLSLIDGETKRVCEITQKAVFSLDSSNMQPQDWQCISHAVFDALPFYDGIIITHGTDTLAYTSSMLCFMLRGLTIPVVLTGSQLPMDHPLTDAAVNLRTALAMAQSGVAGVFEKICSMTITYYVFSPIK